MGLVVDAQIIKGYFQETVLGKDHDLTASPSPLFDSSFRKHPFFIDADGTLEHEWRSVVEKEWFDAWYPTLISNGDVVEIEAKAEKKLRRELESLGFPVTGRDIWYARVANVVGRENGFAILISEDLDFYEPKEKQAGKQRRTELLLKEKGSVRRYFKREREVLVKPVARFVSDYLALCAGADVTE